MEKKKNKWIVGLILVILLLIILILFLLFWNKKSFEVTFDTNGGTSVENIKVKDGEIVSLPTPTKDGYTFLGWVDEEGRVIIKGIKLSDNISLKASWVDNNSKTVTVFFDTDGGNEIGNVTMEKDKMILLPIDPEKEGYIFYGWINEGGNIISPDMIVSDNITLKAYWIKKDAKTSTITVGTDGGNSINPIVVEDGKVILLPVNPTKDGYVFNGWVDENGNEVTKDTIVNGNITIKATWKKTYTCPSGCTPIEDGSKCSKEVTTNIVTSTTCPSGYKNINGKCVNTSTKYHATNGNSGWYCNSSSDYMYSEEDGFGGAFMWCAKTSSVIKNQGCPNGYTQSGNSCTKTETINCTAN